MGRNRIGILSLAAAAAGFLLVTFQPWLRLERVVLFGALNLHLLLSAFFDASLVGALADWFAVTALFRSPVGIPLPHTDILARNRDAIAEAVPRFLTSFVSEQALAAQLAGVDYAARLERFLSEPVVQQESGELLRERLAALLGVAVQADGQPTESLAAVVRETIRFAGERVDPASAAGAILGWVIREGLDVQLVRGVVGAARVALQEHLETLTDSLTPLIRRNSGWQGIFVGRGTVERLLRGAVEELDRVRSDERHELRLLLHGELRRLAARLAGETADAEPLRTRVQEAFRSFTSDPATGDRIARVLGSFLQRIRASLGPDRPGFIRGVQRVEAVLLSRLRESSEFREAFNLGVAGLISGLLARGRFIERVTTYLAGLLKEIDVREFVRRVEGAVWNDLQYIRVNGAVVGGIVGILLAVVIAAFPR